MEDYPANSQASRIPKPAKSESKPADEKKIEAVVTGAVSRRKKPLGRRFADTFFGDTLKSAGKFVLESVLLPAFRDLVNDVITQGTERIVYGDRAGGRRSGNRYSNGHVSYNRISSGGSRFREDPRERPRSRSGPLDFDDIVLATRAEAMQIIDRMFDLISQYDQATVEDLYRLLGLTPEHTHNRWGWTDFRGAGVTRISNGYLLDLPRPEPLD